MKCHFVEHHSKKDYLKSIFKIYRILIKFKPDVVHCHLLDANLIGLTAAKAACIKQRIYTRHHSTFHHDYFPEAVKYDRLCNRIATDIVAISENVKSVLIEKEKCNLKKIHLMHHGFDLEKFKAENTCDLKLKYGLTETDSPIIGVIARYVNWKGLKYVIAAFEKLLIIKPKAKLILANAYGPNSEDIGLELKKLAQDSYIEIKFEMDLYSLYHLFDVYVHTPINEEVEAFGQTYVEALAAGIPSVFSHSGIANEFIVDGINAIVVPHKEADSIFNGIELLLNNPNTRATIVKNGFESVQQFNLKDFISKLEFLYIQ